MKYIDVEKLYKQVDELMAHFAKLEKEAKPDDSIYYQGKIKMCSELLDIIDSLQQEQEEKAKTRAAASTCRNCKFSEPRLYRTDTLSCTKRIVNKFYTKVVRPSESCDLFERKEE